MINNDRDVEIHYRVIILNRKILSGMKFYKIWSNWIWRFELSVMQINVKLLWMKLFKDEMKWSGKNRLNEKAPEIHETIVSPIYIYVW